MLSIPSSNYSLDNWNNRNHMSALLGSVHTVPAKLNYSPWAIRPVNKPFHYNVRPTQLFYTRLGNLYNMEYKLTCTRRKVE